jgi:aspartyl protease family protein
MIYLGLGALALVIIALVVSDGSDSVGGVITQDNLAHLAWTASILAVVIAVSWRRLLTAPLRHVQAIGAWLAMGLILVVGYTYRESFRETSARVAGELRPGTAVSGPGGTVTITRRSNGSFQVEALAGGVRQAFMFDTGASSVVLTSENAAALGFQPRPDEFITRVWTANGSTRTAPIQLASITVGTITVRNVNASVAQPGALTENLLGQTFLDRLGGYEVRGDRLILTPKR